MHQSKYKNDAKPLNDKFYLQLPIAEKVDENLPDPRLRNCCTQVCPFDGRSVLKNMVYLATVTGKYQMVSKLTETKHQQHLNMGSKAKNIC